MSYRQWKAFDGYESYQHLEAGRDHEAYDLLEAISPFEADPVELTEAEEARLVGLMDERITVAVHEHPIVHPRDMAEALDYVADRHVATHYEGLSRTPLDAVFDGLLHGMEAMETTEGWAWDDVVSDVAMRTDDVARSGLLFPARTVADIERAHDEGRIAWFPALEALTPIGNVLDRLDMLSGMGVRMAGLTYNETNQLGSGAKEPGDGGLTALGRRAVERMNALGLAVGLSHESRRTMLEVCEVSDDPVLLSHTAARGVWNTKRAQPDEVLEAVAGTGGLIAIEGAHSSRLPGVDGHTLEGVMAHFEYAVDLVGIDHVTFATDTIYGDHEALMEACFDRFSVAEVFTHADDDGFEPDPDHTHVVGNENPTEAWNNVPRWLIANGYSDDEIAKVTGENALRVLGEAIG